MARSLKSVGLRELNTLRKRVERQYLLDRIARPDRDELVSLLNKVEARITSMGEKNEHGMEEFGG